MPKILGATAGQISLGDGLMIAGAKVVLEKALAMIVGNGSVLSGATKIGGAFAVQKLVGGKFSDIVSTALMVDGTEDIVTSFLPKFSGGLFGDKKVEVELI